MSNGKVPIPPSGSRLGGWNSPGARPAEPSGPTVLETFIDFRFSPLRNWGVRRSPRWLYWAMPPLVWLIVFVAILIPLALYRASRYGAAGSLTFFLTSAIYRRAIGQAYLMLLYTLGVFAPLAVFLPWKIAVHFRDFWTPLQLRELVLTRLNVWEIFWGIIVPPSRPFVILAGATTVFFPLVYGFWGATAGVNPIGDWGGRVFAFLEFSWLSGLVAVMLVIGLCQRRRRTGIAAFAIAMFATLFFPVMILLSVGPEVFEFGGATAILLPFIYGPALLGVKAYAFHSVPAQLAEMVGD